MTDKTVTPYTPPNRSMFAWRIVTGLLLLGLTLLPVGWAWAASVEYRVKGAFLYNFTKFIEWPGGVARKTQPFVIGVLGEDPFGDEMAHLTAKSVGQRPLAVQHYPSWNEAVAGCDILFISNSQSKTLEDIIQRLDGTPVLTVGDTPGFARRGVMINLFMEANKVRFEVNLKMAQQAGLTVSSRLLKLAVMVE